MLNIHFLVKQIKWETPQDLFDELNAESNFTLDPCVTKDNYKCNKYYITRHWYEYIFDKAEIVFLHGRLKFGGSKNSISFHQF